MIIAGFLYLRSSVISCICHCHCRSECPVGFEPVNFNDLDDCPAVEDDGSSLWLIKVPHDVSFIKLIFQIE